jgi:hypothetical protein
MLYTSKTILIDLYIKEIQDSKGSMSANIMFLGSQCYRYLVLMKRKVELSLSKASKITTPKVANNSQHRIAFREEKKKSKIPRNGNWKCLRYSGGR